MLLVQLQVNLLIKKCIQFVLGNLYIFPVSNLIYFQPTATMTGAQTLGINNLFAPGYTLTNSLVSIKGWSVVSNKIKDQFKFDATLNVAVCSNFALFEQTLSTRYSSQNNATLTIKFMTGKNILYYIFLKK